jgi:hypothetical protein
LRDSGAHITTLALHETAEFKKEIKMKASKPPLLFRISVRCSIMFGSALAVAAAAEGPQMIGPHFLRTIFQNENEYLGHDKKLTGLKECPVEFIYRNNSTHTVAIKTRDGYVCPMPNGEIRLVETIGSYEWFTIVPRENGFFSLQTVHHTYLMANLSTKEWELSPRKEEWEKFTFEKTQEESQPSPGNQRLMGDHLLRTIFDEEDKKYFDCDRNLRGVSFGCAVGFIYLDDTTVALNTREGYLSANPEKETIERADSIGPNERFTIVPRGSNYFSLKTSAGIYLMAHSDRKRLEPSQNEEEWEKFRFEKLLESHSIELTTINDCFATPIFTKEDNITIHYNKGVQFPRVHSAADLSHSWLYMPLIKAALVTRNVKNPAHLTGVQKESDAYSSALPDVFDTFVKILVKNLEEGSKDRPIEFRDDVLSIGADTYTFDNYGHMVGDHQTRFISNFLKASTLPSELIGNAFFKKIKELPNPDMEDLALGTILTMIVEAAVARRQLDTTPR